MRMSYSFNCLKNNLTCYIHRSLFANTINSTWLRRRWSGFLNIDMGHDVFFFRFFFTHLVYVNSKSRTLGKGAPCCVTFREIFANSSTYHLLIYLRIILYFIICLFILSGTLTFFFRIFKLSDLYESIWLLYHNLL